MLTKRKLVFIVFGVVLSLFFNLSKALAQDKIGIVPFKVFGPFEIQYLKDAIPEMLYSRLNFSNKEIIKKEYLKEILKDTDTKDELALAKQFLSKTDFTCIVMGSYTKMGEAFSLDVKVIRKDDKEFKTFFVALDKESKIFEAVSNVTEKVTNYISGGVALIQPVTLKAVPKEAKGFKRFKVIDVKTPLYGIVTADAEKTGKKMLVTAGYSSLTLYNWEGDKLTASQTIELKGQEILYINSGDFNKNGKLEIYVTSIFLEDVLTTVFEVGDDGRLAELTKGSWYVKVINHPDLGEVLIGQRMGFNEAFSGEIYLLDLKSSGIVAKSKFEIIKDLNLYQVTPIKYKSSNAFAYFDDGDYLKIADTKGKIIERLKDRYDGSTLGIIKGFDDVTRDKKFTPINSRLIRIPDGDTDVLLTIKNEGSRLFIRSKKFERGTLTLLKFDEVNYKEEASSEVIDGYISDFAIDFVNKLVYASVVTENKEGRIFIFNLLY